MKLPHGQLIRATAKIQLVVFSWLVFWGCVIHINFKSLPSGFPERLINLLTTFHTCPHTLIGLPCTGGSEELRRIEIRLAAKSNNKQIINMNRQYYLYSHDRRVVAYPPSYGSVGSFLVHFVAQQKGSSKSVANVLMSVLKGPGSWE